MRSGLSRAAGVSGVDMKYDEWKTMFEDKSQEWEAFDSENVKGLGYFCELDPCKSPAAMEIKVGRVGSHSYEIYLLCKEHVDNYWDLLKERLS